MRCYLIRHGETDYNLQRRMQGHSEVPLNDRGIAQAARLARRLAAMPLDRIYASDLRRAAMTAGIIAAHTGAPVQYDPIFRERNPGLELTDKSYDETQAFFTDLDYEPPGGESFAVFADRVRAAFERLLENEASHDPHIAVVTHGMVCGAFLRVFLNMSHDEIAALTWPNASLTIVDYHDGWRLHTLGDASHLEGLVDAGHSTGA